MAEPSKKSEKVNEMLDRMSAREFGHFRSSSIRRDACTCCGGPAHEFRDALSRKEFSISGMCQKCQDSVFGG